MMGNYHVRFGGGRLEKGQSLEPEPPVTEPPVCPSLPLHYGPHAPRRQPRHTNPGISLTTRE